jgi:hypothetical protein
VRDRGAGTTELVSVSSTEVQGNSGSEVEGMSADGRYVVFESFANNLVPNDQNRTKDIFVRDRLTGTTELVSVSSDEELGNGYSYAAAASSDGRYIAFESHSSNLVPGDSNGTNDVFIRDQTLGTTERVSLGNDGTQGNNRISDGSSDPSISADGRLVAFVSWASNLVPGDTNEVNDIFVRDRVAGTTRRVSVTHDGLQANERSFQGTISPDGRLVQFKSKATNLVARPQVYDAMWGDTFVRDLVAGTTEQISVPTTPARPGRLHLTPPEPTLRASPDWRLHGHPRGKASRVREDHLYGRGGETNPAARRQRVSERHSEMHLDGPGRLLRQGDSRPDRGEHAERCRRTVVSNPGQVGDGKCVNGFALTESRVRRERAEPSFSRSSSQRRPRRPSRREPAMGPRRCAWQRPRLRRPACMRHPGRGSAAFQTPTPAETSMSRGQEADGC